MTTLYDEHGNIIEPTGDASPVGFCPYCDYQLVAVGVCPECGETVAVDNLRARSRHTRRRLLIKRLVMLALFAAAIWGGREFYLSNIWYRALPTSWLTEMYPVNIHAVKVLEKRLSAAELSRAEVEAIVDKSFSYSFDLRSPRPNDIELSIAIQQSPLRNSLFNATSITGGQQYDKKCVVSLMIDGDRIGKNARNDWRRTSGYLGITEEHNFTATLQPGFHSVSVKWRVQAARRPGNGNSNPKIPVAGSMSGHDFLIEKVFEREFQILDQGVCDLISCQFDDALVDDIMKHLGICLVRESTVYYTHIVVDSSQFESSALIGQIHALTPTQSGMRAEILIKQSDAYRSATWANSPSLPVELRTRYANQGKLPEIENRSMLFFQRVESDSATIVFVPDPGMAFESGRNECPLPCILWRDVPIQDLPLSGLDPISARPKLSYPDAVWSWNDDRDIAEYLERHRWHIGGDAEEFQPFIDALPERLYE